MFSQFRNVVEGLAQPRLQQAPPRRSGSLDRASSLAERPQKSRLEERLRASFTIGDVSNPSTPPASSRVSPAPQFVAEHPLSFDHPLSPAAIPLPNSPPPNSRDSDHDVYPSLTLPDPLPTAGSSSVIVEPKPINQHPPSESPPTDPPIISPAPEQSPAASEEDTEEQDTTESIPSSEISHDQDDELSDASVLETPHEDQHESSEVPMLAEGSQSAHSASADVESLQEQPKMMEQQFAGQWRLLSLSRHWALIPSRCF